MSVRRLFGAASLMLVIAGCGSSSDTHGAGGGGGAGGAQSGPTKGTAALRFGVTDNVKSSMALVDPLKGKVYGSLYLSEDVSLFGPRDGVVSSADVDHDVDVTTADTSATAWKSPELDPGLYVFLGMFDVDDNSAGTSEPDSGDPVTLPTTNKFEIKAGTETSFDVKFDLVYN